MNIEDLLRQTFADMARDEEPPPPERFLAGRPPLPRQAWRPVAAVAGVVVLLAATVLILRGIPGGTGEPDPADARRPVPAAELWPHAVHALPRRLPNGLGYRPELFLDARTLLVRTGAGDSADPAVWWSYDVRSRTAKRLVAFEPPPGTDHTSAVVTGGGRLLWFTVAWDRDLGLLDLWTVPVTGGTPHKVTTIRQSLKQGAIDLLAIAGGDAVWSHGTRGGIYRAPLSGGDPVEVPGTDGLHLLRWPWASRAERPSDEPSDPRPSFRRLVNVLTGERRDAAPGSGDCSLSWCMTRAGVRPRGGGAARSLPAPSLNVGGPALDRFLLLARHDGLLLHDLKTRRTADLGLRFPSTAGDRPDSREAVTMSHTTRYVLTYDHAGERIVINLPAIR